VTSDKAAEIRRLAAEITGEPLARIMFGSRELFHSNLLAWFCEAMPDRATGVFDELLNRDEPSLRPGDEILVERELRHMDLVVRWTNDRRRPVIIENKVFALPDFVQLDRYAADLRADAQLAKGDAVLLSLSDPRLPDDRHISSGKKKSDKSVAWRRVSYGSLAAAIAKALPGEESDYPTETMRHYARLIAALHGLAALLEVSTDEDERVFLDPVLRQATDDKQLVSSLSKLRARNVATFVEQSLPDSKLKRWSSVGYSNGSPTMEISYALANTSRSTVIGWQLQGAQFRLFAALRGLSGRTKTPRARRERWGEANLDVFDFGAYEQIFGRSPLPHLPAKKSFNRFDPDFIYRYVDASSITLPQLVQAARERQNFVGAFAPQEPSASDKSSSLADGELA
jgi:hypothetical protein